MHSLFTSARWRKRFARWDIVDFSDTGKSGNFSGTQSGNFSRNEMPGSVRQRTLVELLKKNIIVFRLLKENWRIVANRLQHEIACVSSCIDPAILYVYSSSRITLDWIAANSEYFNMGWRPFRSLHNFYTTPLKLWLATYSSMLMFLIYCLLVYTVQSYFCCWYQSFKLYALGLFSYAPLFTSDVCVDQVCSVPIKYLNCRCCFKKCNFHPHLIHTGE